MEIEVGEYVRTKKGNIGKILIIYGKDSCYKNMNNYSVDTIDGAVYEEDIKLHSKNIIDLIEVGDLIQLNGAEELKYEVLKISWSEQKGKHIHIINPFRMEGGKDIFIEDIKSIVTKEMYKSVEYEVE